MLQILDDGSMLLNHMSTILTWGFADIFRLCKSSENDSLIRIGKTEGCNGLNKVKITGNARRYAYLRKDPHPLRGPKREGRGLHDAA